uniref:Late embryogenesis abundant protein LEA-2 subgroup domain-containing protein n=1 Tax=Cucumis sativus TaxID=3659 RepID=A0A0A0LT76_CUCSA
MANSTNGRWPPPHPETQTHPHCFNFSPFIRGFAAGITLLLFIVCIIYILQYLIFRPILLALRLDSLQFVNFSATAAAPSWVVGFSINNPNKKLAISFRNLESSIYYKDNIIAQARTRRFLLPPRNSTTLVSPFIADLLVDESVLNDIHGDLERGTIDFTVVVLGYANVEIGVWRPIGTDIRVVCSDLSVKFSWPPGLSGRSGQLVGGSRQCHLH